MGCSVGASWYISSVPLPSPLQIPSFGPTFLLWQQGCHKVVKCPSPHLYSLSIASPPCVHALSWPPPIITPYTHLCPNDIMVPGHRLLTPPLSPLSPLCTDSLVRMCHLT